MRLVLSIMVFLSFYACASVSTLDPLGGFWVELDSDYAYLYKDSSKKSIASKEIEKGSILYLGKQKGAFRAVYTYDPEFLSPYETLSHKFYVYRPSFKRLTNSYSGAKAKLKVVPFDPNKNYRVGPRGGCFYINRNGNKTYVERSYCGLTDAKKSSYSTTRRPSSQCNTVQCSAKTKSGARCRNKTKNCSGRCHVH